MTAQAQASRVPRLPIPLTSWLRRSVGRRPTHRTVPAAVLEGTELIHLGGGESVPCPGIESLPLAASDAENMMNAFTQAEPHRQDIPDAGSWEPQPAGLSEGLFWALQPSVVGVSVTPPQQTPDGLVPHWTLAFDDEDGSQVQIAVSDPMCVQIVRALAGVAHGEGDATSSED